MPISLQKQHKLATPRQINYMLILFNELGFTINSRNVWLAARFERKFQDIGEVRFFEAMGVLEWLKKLRKDQQSAKGDA